MRRYEGHIDSVTSRGVEGWILDRHDPEQLAQVTCRGEDGAIRVLQAHVSRQDVQQAVSLTGRFGFAFPISALADLGSIVTFTDPDGGLLHGGDAVKMPDACAQEPDDNPTLVVLHIQKTAGTSLRIALAPNYGASQTVLLYPDPATGLTVQELRELPPEQRQAVRLLIGHMAFGTGALLDRACEYVTFLRKPEARLRSHFVHHVARETQWAVDGRDVDARVVVQQALSDEFDNLMTRCLSGVGIEDVPLGAITDEHVQLALHRIRTAFRFVGLQDRTSEHYGLLCDTLRLPHVRLPTTNKKAIRSSALLEAELDWGYIMDANRFDAMLYDTVIAEGLAGRDLHPQPVLPGAEM